MDEKNAYPDLNKMTSLCPVSQPSSMSNQQVVVHTSLRHGPQQMTCPSCKSNILTKVNTKPNIKTHILALWLSMCCWFICCCFVPYCKLITTIQTLNCSKMYQICRFWIDANYRARLPQLQPFHWNQRPINGEKLKCQQFC